MVVDKSKTYPEENAFPEVGLYKYLYKPGEQHVDLERRAAQVL